VLSMVWLAALLSVGKLHHTGNLKDCMPQDQGCHSCDYRAEGVCNCAGVHVAQCCAFLQLPHRSFSEAQRDEVSSPCSSPPVDV
jgi:hypothetical protein